MAKPKVIVGPTSTYSVLRNILHDGDFFTAGDTIDLTDDQAEALLVGGIIELPVAAKNVVVVAPST